MLHNWILVHNSRQEQWSWGPSLYSRVIFPVFILTGCLDLLQMSNVPFVLKSKSKKKKTNSEGTVRFNVCSCLALLRRWPLSKHWNQSTTFEHRRCMILMKSWCLSVRPFVCPSVHQISISLRLLDIKHVESNMEKNESGRTVVTRC